MGQDERRATCTAARTRPADVLGAHTTADTFAASPTRWASVAGDTPSPSVTVVWFSCMPPNRPAVSSKSASDWVTAVSSSPAGGASFSVSRHSLATSSNLMGTRPSKSTCTSACTHGSPPQPRVTHHTHVAAPWHGRRTVQSPSEGTSMGPANSTKCWPLAAVFEATRSPVSGYEFLLRSVRRTCTKRLPWEELPLHHTAATHTHP